MPFSSVYRFLNPCRIHQIDTCVLLLCTLQLKQLPMLPVRPITETTCLMFVEHEHAIVHNYLFPEVSRVDVAADSACAVHHDRRVRGHILKMGWKLHAA